MFTYDGYEKCYECQDCKETEKALEHARDHMQGIIDMLYGNEKLDIAMMESNIDEVCWILGLKFKPPAHLPQIERRKTEILRFVQDLHDATANFKV